MKSNFKEKSLIDIGANLTNKRFKSDLTEVFQRAQEEQVDHIILTGTSEKSSVDAFRLAQRHAGFVTSTAGVHPHDAKHWNESVKKKIIELTKEKEVVAVGECGLDFNRNFSSKKDQEKCFIEQLEIAVEIQKPLFLHERDSHDRFIEILKGFRDKLSGAVVHCYTGNLAQLEAFLEIDCHIGITGWVCDERRGKVLQSIVKHIPDDRLMIETDAPFLTPHNMEQKPKGGRNEPAFLPFVVKKIAEARGQTELEVAKTTTKTAIEFFNL